MVDKNSEFYRRSLKSWLEKNAIEISSTHNEGKSIAAERFIRTLKNKIHKYMTSISKNLYIYKSGDMVNKYNNTYPKKIKMKPVHLKSDTYINFSKKTNDKDPKFKIDGIVRISKCKTIFGNSYFPNWCEEFFWLKKLKKLFRGQFLLVILKVKQLFKCFAKKWQKTNIKEFRVEKVIKAKDDELYVKWKG